MGSAPRWRRQSRFFSPTVDYVLRRAPCEVMVVTYPEGVLEEDGRRIMDIMKALIVGCRKSRLGGGPQPGRRGLGGRRRRRERGSARAPRAEWRPGSSTSGTGWTRPSSRAPGIADADACVASTDGDNTNIVVAQVAKQRYEVPFVAARILDPARADFYSDRGFEVVSPTKTAIDELTHSVLLREAAS